jgi:hypothetical protein
MIFFIALAFFAGAIFMALMDDFGPMAKKTKLDKHLLENKISYLEKRLQEAQDDLEARSKSLIAMEEAIPPELKEGQRLVGLAFERREPEAGSLLFHGDDEIWELSGQFYDLHNKKLLPTSTITSRRYINKQLLNTVQDKNAFAEHLLQNLMKSVNRIIFEKFLSDVLGGWK